MSSPAEELRNALKQDDSAAVRRLLEGHGELKARINETGECGDGPAITCVRSREMLDALLENGADINAKTHWWAGGFGLLHTASPEIAAYAIARGA